MELDVVPKFNKVMLFLKGDIRMTECRWHIPPIWVPLMILLVEDNSGRQFRLPVSPLFIDRFVDNVHREVGQVKRELQNITKILNKINK